MFSHLIGFNPSGVDCLIKLGGSLLGDLANCRKLATLFDSLAETKRIVLFPGGGPIDNYIESLDEQLSFAPEIHHQLCARAQDQTGLIFGSLCNRAEFFTSPVELPAIQKARKVAIMLPMKMIVDLDVFAKSWQITSDTMAAYFAATLGAKKFSILTNVDGLLLPSDQIEKPKLVEAISATEMLGLGSTCVDECLPPFLNETGLACKVMNGANLEAIQEWAIHGGGLGTLISGGST